MTIMQIFAAIGGAIMIATVVHLAMARREATHRDAIKAALRPFYATLIATGGGSARTAESASRHIVLMGIDAPAPGQIGGRQARDALRSIVEGRRVAVRPVGIDSAGRIVATLTVDQADVASAMLRKGFAKAVGSLPYLKIEQVARRNRVGLWSGEYAKVVEAAHRDKPSSVTTPSRRVQLSRGV